LICIEVIYLRQRDSESKSPSWKIVHIFARSASSIREKWSQFFTWKNKRRVVTEI
jgi:hypothetical protein